VATTIAELLVELGVDADSPEIDKLNKALEDTDTQGAKSSNRMKQVGKAIAAVGAIAVGAAAGAIKLANATAETGDRIAKTSRSAGISAESFQRQAHAFDLAGVSQEGFLKATTKMQLELERARNGELTPFVKTLDSIGLSVDELGDSDMALIDFVSAVGDIGDSSRRSALLSQAFGERIGAQLASAADQGKDALIEAAMATQNVYTDEDLANAEAYIDAQTNMKDALASVTATAGNALVPVLTDVTDRVTAFIVENEGLIQQDLPAFIDGLATVIEGAAEFTVEFIDGVRSLSIEMDSLDTNTDAASKTLVVMRDTFNSIADAATRAAEAIGLVSDEEEKTQKQRGLTGAKTVTYKKGPAYTSHMNMKNAGDARRINPDMSVADLERLSKSDELSPTNRELAASYIPIAFEREEGARRADKRAEEAKQEAGKNKGNGKRPSGKKKKHVPTTAELIDAAAQGRSSVGGVEAPRPNVAIAITNNNNFENTFEMQPMEQPQQYAESVTKHIQKQINQSNVEASRLIQPITVR